MLNFAKRSNKLTEDFAAGKKGVLSHQPENKLETATRQIVESLAEFGYSHKERFKGRFYAIGENPEPNKNSVYIAVMGEPTEVFKNNLVDKFNRIDLDGLMEDRVPFIERRPAYIKSAGMMIKLKEKSDGRIVAAVREVADDLEREFYMNRSKPEQMWHSKKHWFGRRGTFFERETVAKGSLDEVLPTVNKWVIENAEPDVAQQVIGRKAMEKVQQDLYAELTQ